MSVATIEETDEFEIERMEVELDRERKAVRAERARQKYAARKERGEAPRPVRTRATGRSRRSKYDPDDYAAEWIELTMLGLRADDIIQRSNPSREWFFDHIRLRVDDAICSSCGDHFSPMATRLLTKCNKACGLDTGNRRSDLPVGDTLWLLPGRASNHAQRRARFA